MHLRTVRQPKIVGVTAVLAGILVGIFGLMAVAQTGDSREAVPAAGLIGASVYSAEGTEVGIVSVVSIGKDGYISEIRFTRPSPMGPGQRTVAVYPDSFVALDGAVVLDMSVDEVDALPVQTAQRGTLS